MYLCEFNPNLLESDLWFIPTLLKQAAAETVDGNNALRCIERVGFPVDSKAVRNIITTERTARVVSNVLIHIDTFLR